MAKKKRSSSRWLQEHEKDAYVQAARRDGYRSRASYKLLDIQKKYSLLRPGLAVVDLGAAPGGWSQVAAKMVGPTGAVYALDVLPMDPITGVVSVQGDFTEDETLESLRSVLTRPIDLVISDMAPNLSGVRDVDQPRSVYLVELALDLALKVTKPGGAFVAKCFEGEGIDDLRNALRVSYRQVGNFKPDASRSRSREIYLVARGLKR